MEFNQILESQAFITYGIPLLICLARITDVSIGTMRIIFVAKGLKYLAPILGFFEISIWLLAITQVMANLNSPSNFLAYALGFSLGNYFGMYIENKLAIGMVVIRIITKRDANKLINVLMEKNYSVTVAEAYNKVGDVNIIFTTLKRSQIPKIVTIINTYNPLAVYSIEDVRYVSDMNFTQTKIPENKRFSSFLRPIRK
jgi:uncharacterized protein YebE (UPF0316 family)